MKLRIHAICCALNEQRFIKELLKSLYPFCSGISVLTQYDRDYWQKPVIPDDTVKIVLNYPDPDGKIHLVCRRYLDEGVARNHEMLSIASEPHRGVRSHGMPWDLIQRFHLSPDYFLIVDADEIYDVSTMDRIIDYLAAKRPRGMRVTGWQYLWTWNQRIPINVIHHHHFGFLKAGTLLKMHRTVTFNEGRLQKLLRILRLPDFSARAFGVEDCPMDVGVFHHGSYLGGRERLREKFSKTTHLWAQKEEYKETIYKLPHFHVPTSDLPINIREGVWPEGFFD